MAWRRVTGTGPGTAAPKICHVATVDLSARFLLLNQMCYLRGKGMRVHVACSDGKWLPEVEAAGIVVHRVEMKRAVAPFSDLSSLLSLYRLFRRERFDLVHLHTPKASLLGALAARMAGVSRLVYTIHGFYLRDGMGRLRREFFLFWERVIASRVHAALSQNRADIETAREAGLYAGKEIRFLGNGIDVARFSPSPTLREGRAAVRRSLGIPPGCRVVGIVARLVREKGILDLFDAVTILSKDFPDVRLLVVGPEEAKDDAVSPREAAERWVADRVVFTGMRLDLPELYSAMDVFALPSYREGFPRTVMEASSMGLPVVATDIRGCREAVADGRTGILVPAGDAKRLAEGIGRILGDAALARAMGEAGRRKALNEFDERSVFRTVLETYRSLGISAA
ncbi:MAG: glycosyltransferase family 4 protein [Thermodesulfobacteriota bacterium]